MKSLLLALAFILVGCAGTPQKSDIERPFPIKSLPAEIRSFPVQTGMTPVQVKVVLRPLIGDASLSSEDIRIVPKGPFVDNPWSGVYWIEYKEGVVSQVRFSLGNLSVSLGYWILSEE